MSTGIKNGELHTFNICKPLLFFFFISAFSLQAFTKDPDNEKNRIVVIDAGHGGKDPGALGSFVREKDITLAIALKTGEYLEKNLNNVKVIYTRKDDSTVDLRDRPKIANKANADLFISIHVNWASSKNVAGAETYVMGIAKDQANLEVAMKENAVMLKEENYSTKYEGFDPTSSESYIMFSLTQKVFQEQSENLATLIQKQFRERVNRNDRNVKQAGFWVLFNTKMPSVLIETGFLTNPQEEKYLNSKEGQDYLASSIYRACKEYLAAIDNRSGITYVQPEEKVPVQDTATESNAPAKQPSPADDIRFMVQVSSSLKKISLKAENFKGLTDVVEIKAAGRYKYASGSFPELRDAVNYRASLENIYPDAFVIAVRDTALIDLNQALELKRKTKQ